MSRVAFLIHYNSKEREQNRALLREVLESNQTPCYELVKQPTIKKARFTLIARVVVLVHEISKMTFYTWYRISIKKLTISEATRWYLKELTLAVKNSLLKTNAWVSAEFRRIELERILKNKHLQAWSQFMASSKAWLMVLEDDAEVLPSSHARMTKIHQGQWEQILQSTHIYIDLAGGFSAKEVVTLNRIDEHLKEKFYVSSHISTNTTCAYMASRKLVSMWASAYQKSGPFVKLLPVDHLINALALKTVGQHRCASVHWIKPIFAHGSMTGSMPTMLHRSLL
jgi:hypothetical protein